MSARTHKTQSRLFTLANNARSQHDYVKQSIEQLMSWCWWKVHVVLRPNVCVLVSVFVLTSTRITSKCTWRTHTRPREEQTGWHKKLACVRYDLTPEKKCSQMKKISELKSSHRTNFFPYSYWSSNQMNHRSWRINTSRFFSPTSLAQLCCERLWPFGGLLNLHV